MKTAWVPVIITSWLLMLFGMLLFAPVLFPKTEYDQTLVQTLINLTIASVSFFIGASVTNKKPELKGPIDEPGTQPPTGS